jgi:hypothetical protein
MIYHLFDDIFFYKGHNNFPIAFESVISRPPGSERNINISTTVQQDVTKLSKLKFRSLAYCGSNFNPRLPRFSVDIGQVRVEYGRSYPTLEVTASHFFI